MIARGFTRGRLSNNAYKRHVRILMAIESKKVKLDDKENGQVISFFDENHCEGFD